MNKQECLDLLKASKNNQDWNTACDRIKAAHGNNYPGWWFESVIQPKLADQVLGQGASEIKLLTGDDALNFLGLDRKKQVDVEDLFDDPRFKDLP